MKVKVGDWVRFYRDGALVLGVVSYIRKREAWELCNSAQTDQGEVSIERVLEVRAAGMEVPDGA